MATPQQTSAEGGAGVEAESPWRRDEVTYLLHAWRDVAADSTGVSTKADARETDQRIFDKFCGFFDDGGSSSSARVKRSLKSLMKTKKSLLRSFRFIAVFNQNHVIARTMSSFGGSNWFALPEDEQRRIVKAHYKRKPFAYIDEDMFDAIEMIQETESRALAGASSPSVEGLPPHLQRIIAREEEERSGAVSIKAEPGVYLEEEGLSDPPPQPHSTVPSSWNEANHGRSTELSRELARVQQQRKQQSTPAPSASASSANSSKMGQSWSRDDMLMLLRAWEECLDNPLTRNLPIAVFDNRVYELFQELSGDRNLMRSALAVRLKKYSLIPTYQFIKDFDSGKILSVGDGLSKQINTWFTASRKYRTAVVQKYYTKSHYAHIQQDMLPIIERIMKKTKSIESRKAGAASASFESDDPEEEGDEEEDDDEAAGSASFDESNTASDDSARVPWTRHETSLLLAAWRYAETLRRDDPHAAKSLGNFNAFIYNRFLHNCGGESSRDEADVAAQKRALVNTYDLILAFNRELDGSGAKDTPSPAVGDDQGWFSLRKGERNRIILQANRSCTDIDEHTYKELRWILKAARQNVRQLDQAPQPARRAPVAKAQPAPPTLQAHAAPPQHGLYAVRAVTVWNRDEVLHLLRAWTEILDGPCPPNESQSALNHRIYDRFFTFVGGTTTRTVKALHAKRDSVIASYQFITDFNKNKMIAATGGGTVAWGTNDWYSLSHDEQKNIVKAHYKKSSFSYLYSDMLPIVEEIIAKVPQPDVQQQQQQSEPGLVAVRKPRPNSWTPEELESFLRAWYEAVHENPRQETETANAFNARLHRRFKELCGGRTKKPEVSLLTKRRVLTSTYEFIAEYNRKHVSADWFQMNEVDRRKRMMGANKVVHTCTNIEEDVFKWLDRILGTGSAVGNRSGASATPRVKPPTPAPQPPANTTASFEGSSKAPSFTSPRSMKRRAKPAVEISSRQTRSRAEPQDTHPYYSTDSIPSAEQVQKKRKVDGAQLSVIARLFETQTQHFASLLHQIKEERKAEHDERQQLLSKIQRDQEERQRDREERAAEREYAKLEWEQYREERKFEREQDRVLLLQVFGLHPPAAAPATDSEVSGTEQETEAGSQAEKSPEHVSHETEALAEAGNPETS